MAAHIIRKVSDNGIGYSVINLNDVCHLFAAAVPRHGHTLRQQADDVLDIIEAAAHEEGSRGAIVHQAVFMADIDQLDECRQIIHDFYGTDLPATSYIPQAPSEGKLLAIECMGVGQSRGRVEIDRVSEQLVVARHNGIAWAHCAQTVSPSRANGVYDGAWSSFDQTRSLLDSVHVGFGQVLRTWLYCGAIGGQDGTASRYQELNRARSDFFKDIRFLNSRAPEIRHDAAYPASTGIGADGRGVMMDTLALATDRKDIVVVPLENPRQTPAYDYAIRYSPISPRFSRGLAVSCGNYATIFISGTASIVGQETRHQGDAVAQTHETLENIAALISEENFARHGLTGLGCSLAGLALARVYLKRPEDYAKIRAVCEEHLGELPVIYAVADICRPELLVEIEGIAFSSL